MTTSVYTREKLQGLAEENRRIAEARALESKRQAAHACIQNVIAPQILQAAGASKTSYLHRRDTLTRYGGIPLEDLVNGLRAWFPDCKITYTQEWVDVPPRKGLTPTRELKEGILIDWS